MSRPVRILVVDDSVVVRRVVSEMLGGDLSIEVVGTAPNGRLALEKMGQLSPDLVVLDMEMPEMGGLEVLERIRASAPKLPVLVFSALTERGGALTLEALARGASDYVTKPSTLNGGEGGLPRLREELVGKARALTTHVRERPPVLPAAGLALADPSTSAPVEVIVIASSTGGPNAVGEIFTRLGPDFPVPILIAQHMPPMFTRLFAERLAQQSGLVVREGEGGAPICRGEAWVAPGDFHMEARRDALGPRLVIQQGPQENSCRPAADVLFRSAAACYGAGVLAVVLTGMGQDGLRGAQEVRRCGGQVLAQDQATSVVWSMPGAVASAGLAERVLPIEEMGPELLRRVRGAPLALARGERS